MGPKPAENADFTLHLEGEPVSLGNPSFPNVSRVFHLFDIKRRMALAAEKELQLAIYGLLEVIG